MGGFNNVIFNKKHYDSHLQLRESIERVTVLLQDKETTATIYPIFDPSELPYHLLKFLSQEFNDEIARGDTQPFLEPLTVDEFKDYWFGQFGAVMAVGDEPKLSNDLTIPDWEKKCVGTLFIKTAYPGRSSHVCTGNFLVNAGIRNSGIGTTLVECFLTWSPRLGYSYAQIELIYECNKAARRVLEKQYFNKTGSVKCAGSLKGFKRAVDAFNYGRDLDYGESEVLTKFEMTRQYLLTGFYPRSATKADKARIRASSVNYSVVDGKLYMKGKEVIDDPEEQADIVRALHQEKHAGINKLTSALSEKYHWLKIKATVARVIRECEECKSSSNKPMPKKFTGFQTSNPNSSTNIGISDNNSVINDTTLESTTSDSSDTESSPSHDSPSLGLSYSREKLDDTDVHDIEKVDPAAKLPTQRTSINIRDLVDKRPTKMPSSIIESTNHFTTSHYSQFSNGNSSASDYSLHMNDFGYPETEPTPERAGEDDTQIIPDENPHNHHGNPFT